MHDIRRGFFQAMRDFGAIFALPTWIIVRCVLPFINREHPWYGQRFGLTNWARGRTRASCWFDAVFWVYIIAGFAIFAR